MKASLYQVLGIPPNAKVRQIRAAIRRLIAAATCLPFLAKDEAIVASGLDSPELPSDILCLAHHASFILLDLKRRAQYDLCLAKNLHRQNLSRNRYKTLIQYTGGAVRKSQSYTGSGSRVYPGSEHIGVLPVGFGINHETYFRYVQSFLFQFFIILFVLFSGVWLFSFCLPYANLPVSKYLGFLWQILKIVFIFMLPSLLILSITLKVLGRHQRVSLNTGFSLDAAMLSLLELCESWRSSDRIFLGEEMPLEDSSWIFHVKMGHLTRIDHGVSAKKMPGRRIFAFLIDVSIWILLLFFILKKMGWATKMVIFAHPIWGTILFEIGAIFSWLLVEAFFLAFFHTTLGRILAGVSHHFMVTVLLPRSILKNKWSDNFYVVFQRAVFIWLHGIGMAIWPIEMYFIGQSLYAMKYKEETLWNAAADGIVMVHSVTILHTLLGIFFILFAVLAWVLLFFPVQQ